MPTAEAEHDIHQLENLDVERTDGVDRPATRRKFLLAKSEDADELQVNAEKLAADANQLAQLGAMVVQVLCSVDMTLGEEEATVLNAFAKMLGIQPCFAPGTNPMTTGGDMAMRAVKDDKEIEESEEEVEEEETEEVTTEKTQGRQGKFTGPGGPSGAKRLRVVDQSNQKGTNGPPKKGTGSMPKGRTRKHEEVVEEEEETEETVDETYISQEDLENRVSAAVEKALEDQLSPLLEKMEAFFTGAVEKSQGRRPVSKQANGQDRVEKSAPKAVGEGVFTNIVF